MLPTSGRSLLKCSKYGESHVQPASKVMTLITSKPYEKSYTKQLGDKRVRLVYTVHPTGPIFTNQIDFFKA